MAEPKTPEDKARKEFKETVEYGSRHDRLHQGTVIRTKVPGLCGKCSRLKASQSSLGRAHVVCAVGMSGFTNNDGESIINVQDPIVECSEFWPRYAMSLSEMADQARYIVTVERMGQYL